MNKITLLNDTEYIGTISKENNNIFKLKISNNESIILSKRLIKFNEVV